MKIKKEIEDITNTTTMKEWKPISTAPKDRDILVCQSQNGLIKVGHWEEYSGMWHTDIAGSMQGITHWMELPTPPTA
jgi:hypothetical protein